MVSILVKLKDSVYVDADDVKSVLIHEGADYIRVTTKSGETYSIGSDYGAGIYATLDRLVKEINTARGN